MRRPPLARPLLALWLLTTASAAHAAVPVAVLGIEPVGAATDLATHFVNAVKKRVQQTAGFRLVPGTNLDEVKLVFGCVDEKPACMARVGRSLKAEKLIWGRLQALGAGFRLTLHLLDVDSAKQDQQVTENISRAEAVQADETVARVTQSFLVPAAGTIKLSVNISGAEVLLGDQVRGTTDGSTMLLREVPSGSYVLLVRKPTHRSWRKTVQVAGGQTTDVNVMLERIETAAPGTQPEPVDEPPIETDTRTGWKIAFWTGTAVTVGLAAVMVATGLSVQSLEDDKSAKIEELLKSGKLSASQVEGLKGSDACSAAQGIASAGEVVTICDDGNSRATLFNGLLGAAIVTAAVSGFFLYKAYIKSGPADDVDDYASRPRPRWRVLSGASPTHAQVGFALDF